MATFQPPPTYAEVVLYDKGAKDPEGLLASAKFNPLWLKWFLDLVKGLGSGGGGSGTVTTVSVSPTNGITASVTNPTTVPSIAIGLSLPWAAWTPVRTNWTDVGVATVTARYVTISHVTYFQIKVVPGTTSATVAGTSYVSLPVAAAGLAGDASMQDTTTFVSVGDCVFDVANSRCYVPTKGATADGLVIAGWYET